MTTTLKALPAELRGTLAEAPRRLLGAQIVWEVLMEHGVDVVFGHPGGAIMPTYDALVDYPIHHVLVRHEQSAAHMADGYARASGGVGVAIATSGPGATNLVTGIANAMLDSIPIVCITGQVPSALIGTDAFQETDVNGVTLPITKHNYLVTRAEDLAGALREAFALARAGRQGPVLVDITKDAQLGRARYAPGAPLEAPRARHIERRPALSPRALDQAVTMIEAAERPLILAGHGIIKAGASKALLELVERTQLPVVSTLLGLGAFPASHPRALGMLGMHGAASANQAVQRADLLIAIGMRFDDRVTGDPRTFAPSAQKIHIELDASEINKNIQVELGLLADARDALEALLLRLSGARSLALWHAELRRLQEAEAAHDIIGRASPERLLAAHVIHDLWRLTKGAALLCTDVGQHQMWAAQYYRHERPRMLLTSGGLGTMGFALPAALGARFARPKEEIWVIAGDGGFQMTAAELATLRQEGLKLNIAIINNGYLGMVRQWQELFYERRYVATPLSGPDFALLAKAHGLRGLRVERREEVAPAIEEARAAEESVVIDFRVQQEDIVYPMVPAGAPIDEMIRRPLEDS